MKKAFDAYQSLLVPKEKMVAGHYFLNSRKVVFLAKDAYDGKTERMLRTISCKRNMLRLIVMMVSSIWLMRAGITILSKRCRR